MLRKEEEHREILNTYIISLSTRNCIKCDEKVVLYGQNMVRCKNKMCKYRYSLFKNTPFYSCKVEITTYFKVIDLFLNFVPLELIHRITMLSKERIGKMINNFNHYDIFLNYLGNVSLGGTGNIIEIDESKFGKRKYNRGHKVEGVWIFGAVERTTRRILLVPVYNRSRCLLEFIMFRYIKPYTIIFSDCWKSYSRLKNFFFGHKTVNHSKEFVNRIENVHTNTIEGNWSGIKRNIPIRNRTRGLINIYLLRFMLYRNNKNTMLRDLMLISLIHKFD